MKRSVVLGCGSYLPARIVSNEELSTRVETSDEWIRQRTGIGQRHIAADGELTSDLAAAASARALTASGVSAGEIDLVLLATTTPDHTFPATATRVQSMLGMKRGAAFDIQAVCSGFIFALATADNFLKAGEARTVLVIGAETFTRILDWQDRQTCVLFGDGAGAIVLRAEDAAGSAADRGVLGTRLHTDGDHYSILQVDGGPSSTGTVGHVRMNGKEVFRQAVENMVSVVEEVLALHQLTSRDIDWLVPHQANKRIIDGVGRKLGLSSDRVVVTVDRHANTSAASVPLALCEAVDDGRIKRGDLVLMEAMGGGISWGASLVRW